MLRPAVILADLDCDRSTDADTLMTTLRMHHHAHASRRSSATLCGRSIGLGSLVVVALALLLPATNVSAAEAPDDIVVEGHGLGHGRGMSQYGALGYALDSGWTFEQILDHYYSNTTFGDAVPNDDLLVWLSANDDVPLTVTSQSAFHVGEVAFVGGEAARIRVLGINTFDISRASSCEEDWTVEVGSIAGSPGRGSHGFVEAVSDVEEQSDALGDLLVLCGPNRAYRGALRLVQKGASTFVINRVPIESYLRGVVPQEMAAIWGELGDGAGMHALRAQAVAARSYALALAASRSSEPGGFASDTCDTQSCQVYGGAWLEGLPLDNGPTRATSSLAIVETAGLVRRHDDSRIAFTEFASSTGGWTAPLSEGNAFPAVEDLGDSVENNPNFTWQTTIDRSDVEARWPAVGTLRKIEVTARNGFGDWGGRVRGIRLTGTGGVVSVSIANWSNDIFRQTFGLKSDWYQFPDFIEVPEAPAGFWLAKSDGTVLAFGEALHYGDMSDVDLVEPIVSMTPTGTGHGYWLVASDGGIFSFGDAQFHGSAGGIDLDQPIVDMATTPDGAGYWLAAADGGIFTYGSARFLGSMGGVQLKEPVVGMDPTSSGDGYWLVASDGGIFSFGDAEFFGSAGAINLEEPITGMTASADGAGYWFVATDGGVFAFGEVDFHGSRGGRFNRGPVVSMARTFSGDGYWIVTNTGTSYPFGDAPDYISSVAGPVVVDVAVLPVPDP